MFVSVAVAKMEDDLLEMLFTNQVNHFLFLPYEILLHIVSFCQPGEVLNLSQVCSLFHTTFNSESLWQFVCTHMGFSFIGDSLPRYDIVCGAH